MKRLLIISALLFTTLFYSQEPNKSTPFLDFNNKYYKAVLDLRDGTSKFGLARITQNDEIVFKENSDSKKIRYNYKTLSKMTLDVDTDEKTYVYKIIDGKPKGKNIKLLKVITTVGDGPINLFEYVFSGHGVTMPNANSFGTAVNNLGTISNNSYSISSYYFTKNNGNVVISLHTGNTYSQNFKEIAEKYFSDCPDLLDKINSKFFERGEIKTVIKYYNEECSR